MPIVRSIDALSDLSALGVPSGVQEKWSDPKTVKKFEVFSDPKVRERTERLRSAISTLAELALDKAHASLAAGGALGYQELLLAATALCESPPPSLQRRFNALLVDELQDTNPAQLRFYEAFVGMKGTGSGCMSAFFVGDARQSIFRFREADPHGWRRLLEKARLEGAVAELDVNFRSSRLLVDVQRELVASLGVADEPGVDPLPGLRARDDAPPGPIDDSLRAPVVWVDDDSDAAIDDKTLALFARRLTERWAVAPQESAAVLTRTWLAAARARDLLAESGIKAQLTGDKAVLLSRVAADLRVLLRVLYDPADEVALAALLKHPSIGLEDRGLLQLRTQGGLGRIFNPRFEPAGLSSETWMSLRAPLSALSSARKELGRGSTADVLESIIAHLKWRPLIAAGPEGDGGTGLAQLDILLDFIRTSEAERVDPNMVLDLLDPEGSTDGDLPVVRRGDERGVVTVTTVFSAKGLEFDHVALLECRKTAGTGISDADGRSSLVLARPGGVSLLGVRLDPAGGFQRAADPVAGLANLWGRAEAREEGLRLLYVGFTRAKQSVTLGTGKAKADSLAPVLRRVLSELANRESMSSALRRVGGPEVAVLPPRRPIRSRTLRSGEFRSSWAMPVGRVQVRPSDAETYLDAPALAADLAKRGRVIVGPPAPTLPRVPGLEDVPEIKWGDVVHGWFEEWAFDGIPDLGAATSYLVERWRIGDQGLASWLCDVGLTVRDRLRGFRELLLSAEKVHFELPLIGFDERALWTGRSIWCSSSRTAKWWSSTSRPERTSRALAIFPECGATPHNLRPTDGCSRGRAIESRKLGWCLRGVSAGSDCGLRTSHRGVSRCPVRRGERMDRNGIPGSSRGDHREQDAHAYRWRPHRDAGLGGESAVLARGRWS